MSLSSTGQVLNIKDMLDKKTTGAFVSPFVFDREDKNIYLLINNKVRKYHSGAPRRSVLQFQM